MVDNVFKPLTSSEGLFSGRVKIYPTADGGEDIAQIMICDKQIFNPQGLEKCDGFERSHFTRSVKSECEEVDEGETSATVSPEERTEANFERSSRRAKARLYDIVMCTHNFKYFVTLTISPETADRTDYNAIIHKMNNWLDNNVRRRGLCYALVPEYHADGVSIHFHGFFNDVLPLSDSGKTTKDGRPIYNISGFKFGFSTAIEIVGEYTAVCRYILKYVGKSGQKVGSRFYLSGGKLGTPRYEYFNAELDELEGGKIFSPEGSGRTFNVKKMI